MKKEYTVPEISVVLFEAEDVITTSLFSNDEDPTGDSEIDFGDIFGTP